MASSSSVSCFFLAFLLLFSVIESKKKGGITLDFIHRDSSHSPLHDPSHTRFDRLNSALRRSFKRKSSLQSVHKLKFGLNTGKEMDSGYVESSIVSNGGEYLMKLSIGTPPVEVAAIADTGSDLTWLQCEPCTFCYKQTAPIFDPSRTKTYRRLSCKSNLCNTNESASCGTDNSCVYEIAYGDQSTSSGDLATDTFTFNSNSGSPVEFPQVVFGCGHQNRGTFNETGAGIIGLGDGAISIINQLDESIGGRFSYCLTLIDSNVSSKIHFGSNAIVTGPNVVSTPLLNYSTTPTFYFISLEGISVGKMNTSSNHAHVTRDAGHAASFEQGNMIIDSGTTLSFLPAGIYQQLEADVVKTIKGYKRVKPSGSSEGLFRLCYQLAARSGEFEGPAITFHFQGADLEVPTGGSFLEVEEGVVCLTMLPSNDMGILGNLHQMNVKVGYDLVEKKISFMPTDCSKSD